MAIWVKFTFEVYHRSTEVALINSIKGKLLLHVTIKSKVTQAARGSDDGKQAQYMIGWVAYIYGDGLRAERYG